MRIWPERVILSKFLPVLQNHLLPGSLEHARMKVYAVQLMILASRGSNDVSVLIENNKYEKSNN